MQNCLELLTKVLSEVTGQTPGQLNIIGFYRKILLENRIHFLKIVTFSFVMEE